MNQTIFLFSGLLSLVMTLGLILLVYSASLVARTHIVKWKMMVLILGIYGLINGFYFLKLIPPVPLALDKGLVAYDIQKQHGHYKVSYEVDEWYVFWRDHKIDFHKNLQEPVYVFTSIFAPTDLKKKIYHRWQWYNTDSEAWETIDNIGYTIVGGRDGGFRGYTYKQNIWKGQWKVEVVTNEDLVIGVVDFNINTEKSYRESKLITKTF